MINPEAKRLLYQSENVIALGNVFKLAKLFDMKGNEISAEYLIATRVLMGEGVKNTKVRISHSDKVHFVEVSSIPIYNLNGDLNMVATCFHDITETGE